MKNTLIFLFSILLIIGTVACKKKITAVAPPAETTTNSNPEAIPPPPPPAAALALTTVELQKQQHDFGNIKEGDVANQVFPIKNTGSEPLKIEKVKVSCDCITAEWTQDLIAPGKEGRVILAFDTEGKSGIQKKTATVTLNTEQKNIVLTISANVE